MDLALGTIGVTATIGPWHDVVPRAIQYMTDGPVNHAYIYVGDGQIVEAGGHGAKIADADKYGNGMWLDTMHDDAGKLLTPTDSQRDRMAATARGLAAAHVPYSYLDYVALALGQHRLGLVNLDRPPWWAKRLGDNRRLICSQLVDLCWSEAGVHLFKSRIPGLVSPADLWRLGTPTT